MAVNHGRRMRAAAAMAEIAERSEAEILARVTGSVGATVRHEHRDPETGELIVDSEVTYTRPRTDHTQAINEMRDASSAFHKVYEITGSETNEDLSVSVAAAADLLEIHDAAGLNLHESPALLAFIQRIGGVEVQNNHA